MHPEMVYYIKMLIFLGLIVGAVIGLMYLIPVYVGSAP